MQAFLYYLFLPFIYGFSLLPFPIIYFLSDILYYVLFYILKYRKEVVYTNLTNSFPNKSKEEIDQIAKKYYRYFCDLTLETFKSLTISKEEAIKRCHLADNRLMNQWHAEGKKMILVMGHYGNWEWAGTTISLNTTYPFYIIYRPLHNSYFDKLVNKMRTRFGSKMVPMKGTLRHMASHKSEAIATVFVGDQTPDAEFAYWMPFLNQDTPVFIGTEKIAVKFNDPVVYAWIERVKRGYYLMHYKLLVPNPSSTAEGEITKLHTGLLEDQILKIPQYWLWSHKRWKHKRRNN